MSTEPHSVPSESAETTPPVTSPAEPGEAAPAVEPKPPEGDETVSASDEPAAAGTNVNAAEASPAPTTEASPQSGGEADAGNASGESLPPVQDLPSPVPPAQGSPSPEDQEPPRRKVHLNPTFVPQAARPVPNLGAGQASAPPPEDTPQATEPVADDPAENAAAVEESSADDAVPVPPPTAAPTSRPAPVAIPRDQEIDADTEAELAAALSSGDLEAPAVAVASEEGAPPVTVETLESGTKLKGTIQSIDAENVFVDLGLPMTGLVPLRQFDPKKPPEAGKTVNVAVDKIDEAEGLILCNLPRGRGRVSGDWSSVVVGQTVECRVNGVNKGGLEVAVGSLRGFMPASQVDLGYVSNLESFVGQQVSARVTEVNPARRRLILSRRQLVAEEREETASKMLEEIHPGQVRTGVVRSLKDFAAFVDLGGVDGFLHVSQITWQRISKPSDVLSEGQSVEVKILSVDREKKRISLSLRQMQKNPWAEAEANYAKESNVTGKVTRIEQYGAFVELEPGLEGLVHISELDHKHVKRVEDVLSIGQMVEFQVLEVDPKKKRVSLSLKALKVKPEAPARPKEEDLAPGKGQSYQRKHKGNLKGGIGGANKGGLFGNPQEYK